MKEEVLNIIMPRVDNTCAKCRFTSPLDPYRTFCGKYENKPYSVYFEGKDCPYFEKSKYAIKKEQ